MSGLAETFASELAAVAGTPHPGGDAVALACELAGRPHALVAVDEEPDLEPLVEALQAAGHEVLRPGDGAWVARLPDATLGVTRCVAAVADTGSLFLVAGPGRPRSTSLVPRIHLAVVHEDDLVPSLPDALARVSEPGSAMTCITGPSRSGDIEQILTLGVHGPSQVHVVLPGPKG